MKILIIDDDESFVEELSRRLLRNGHAVSARTSVEGARDALHAERFGVVILDINLRDNDDATVDSNAEGGIQVLKAMRARQSVRTVFMSKYTDATIMTAAAEAGCRYFMFKSLKEDDESAFYATLRTYLDAIRRSGTPWYHLFVTTVTATVILGGIVAAWLGKPSEAGLIVSAFGVLLNVFLTFCVPKRFQ